MDFSDDGLVATAEEKMVNDAAEGLNSKHCEENEANDLVGRVVTCLFAVTLATKTTLTGVGMAMIC